MVLALDFPLGRPLTQAALVRRVRPLPEGATAAVAVNDQVRAEQPVAEYRPPSGPPSRVLAGLSGRVCAVEPGRSVAVESVAAVAQGIVGLGGPAAGPLALLARGESLAVAPIARGSVILFPHQVPLMLLQRAAAGGAVGIIA